MCFGDFSVQYSKHSGCTYLQFSVSCWLCTADFCKRVFFGDLLLHLLWELLSQFLYQDVTCGTKTEKWDCTARVFVPSWYKNWTIILTVNVKVNPRRRHVCRNLLYLWDLLLQVVATRHRHLQWFWFITEILWVLRFKWPILWIRPPRAYSQNAFEIKKCLRLQSNLFILCCNYHGYMATWDP